MKEIVLTISDNLYKYLTFLEKTRFIKSKEEALSTALEFYKKLAIHYWLPYIYRMGGGRVLLLTVDSFAPTSMANWRMDLRASA